MNKRDDREFDLECLKEQAIDFVCNQAADIVGRYNLDSEGSISEDDLFCASDELGGLVRINDKINQCKSEKAVRKLLKKNFGEREIEEAIGEEN